MDYNKPKLRIPAQVPTEELLAGLAEEAAELAKAALKFRRAITQKNPTPVTVDKAWAMLEEEVADTLLILGVLGVVETVGGASKRCEQITQLKIDRWVNRLEGIA